MEAIERAIERARRRWWASSLLTWLGWLSLAGLGVAITMVLCGDLLALVSPWWAYLIVAGAVVLAAPIIAWTRRPSRAYMAELIDERLDLKDRLSTALYVASADASDPFARQVIADANQAAGRAVIRDAFAVRLGRVWGYVPVAASVLALLALFMPGGMDLLGLNQSQQQAKSQQAQAQAAKRQLVKANVQLQDLKKDKDKPQAANADQLMKRLASLTDKDLRTPESRQEAAAKISDLSNKLDQIKRQEKKQFQSLANAMTRLDAGKNGPAKQLANALRRGDFKAAQQQIKRLEKKISQGNLSAQQKKAMQQQLQHMAQQLKQMAKQAKQQAQQRQQQIRQQLSKAGLNSQQIQQLQKQGFGQQAVQKALQQQGMSKQQAQQMSKQIQRQQQQSQSSSQMSHSLGGLSHSFGQMGSSGSGGGQSQFSQGAWSARQQMGQIAQMQQQLQRMGMAQSQMRQAMQQMAGGGRRQGHGMGGGRRGRGVGGIKAGTGSGGNPLGRQQSPINTQARAKSDLEQGKGRVIASWMSDGQNAAGQPKVDFDKTITQAQDEAAQAVSQDRVPRQYHRAIHDYFNQLPASAEQARQAPAAPH